MITGAATATINRLPVLLLPGDIFARRNVAPVLQQLESEHSQDISVNDCFKPVSRYWDRINRPEQILLSLPEAMRVLTSPAETGAVTLALPQDVQAEAYDYPGRAVREARLAHPAQPARRGGAAARRPTGSGRRKRPLIVAGGGVLYSEATEALARFVEATGHPGRRDHGRQGQPALRPPAEHWARSAPPARSAANRIAREADLVIGIGTRYSDFTTACKTRSRIPDVRFININVAEFDAYKHCGAAAGGRRPRRAGRADGAAGRLPGSASLPQQCQRTCTTAGRPRWTASMPSATQPLLEPGRGDRRGQRAGRPRRVMVCAAGSLPGDLHKLWRTRHPKQYHLEYGYSCMGYEIAGGLGVKMAEPEREVYVMVGDGSYLMMANEIVTSVQEGDQADHRADRQPRLQEHRRAQPVVGHAGLRHALCLPQAGPGRCGASW